MSVARAHIIITGDEVLRGHITDRNGLFLAQWFDAHGWDITEIQVVGDDRDRICEAIHRGQSLGANCIVTTGGLGVTHDDLTMAAVAWAVEQPLVLHDDAHAHVTAATARLTRAQVVPTDVQAATIRKQAMLPATAHMLAPIGTAPGAIVMAADTRIVVLPGPPFEMQRMWANAVTHPALADLIDRVPQRNRVILRLHGVAEPEIVATLEGIALEKINAVRLGICAKVGEVEITMTDINPGGATALATEITGRFVHAVFTTTGATIDHVIAELLIARGACLAVAESCTGGRIGTRLTSLPGSSEWFLGGVISYANRLKEELVGVPVEMIDRHGAVSAHVADAMAHGIRSRTGAEWGIAITGIAGPSGGSPEKPVGTVHIGCSGPTRTVTAQYLFTGDRTLIQERAATQALHLLRHEILATDTLASPGHDDRLRS